MSRAEDGTRLRNTRSWIVQQPEQLPKIEQMVTSIQEMSKWLLRLSDAPVEGDYLGPVLFEGQASTEFFRQLMLPQLSATPPELELPDFNGEVSRSIPTSRVGRRLLPEGWSVVDDVPGNPNAVGYYRYDHQGVPPQRVELVKNGVIRDLLMSRVPRRASVRAPDMVVPFRP